METKEKKPKIYIYHTSHEFMSKGKKVDMMTQLYKIGVYAIINNNPAMQMTFNPPTMVNIEKDLKKDEKSGKITDLKFGRAISVYADEDGFWTEK